MYIKWENGIFSTMVIALPFRTSTFMTNLVHANNADLDQISEGAV